MQRLECEVVIVGLGAMGSAAAYQLARRGVDVIGVEQFACGHERGSSFGESRAIRLSYFEHESYVPLVRRAYASWRELEQATNQTVLTRTGILEAGYPGSEVVLGSLSASREHNLAHEIIDAGEIGRRFPAFRLPSDWVGVVQPEGGILNPRLAIDLFTLGAKNCGARLLFSSPVHAIEPRAACVRVQVEDRHIEANTAIVAAGAWSASIVPTVSPWLRVTRQVLGWFTPRQPELFTPGQCPVFILDGPDDACYGFPDFVGTGVKVGSHAPGELVAHPDHLRRSTDCDDESRIRRCLDRYVPAASGNLRRMRACMYTRTPDADFLLDRHPDDGRIIIASPCSGHGFKFASVVGEILADLATKGSTVHDISRFALCRFARATDAGT